MNLGNFGVDVKDEKPKEINDKNLDFNLDNIKQDYTSEEIERYLPWFLKHQIKTFDDLIVTSEIKELISFIENFKKGKGILLCGMPGSGKTTTLRLLGEKFGYEIFEVNASDTRSKKSIIETVGDVVKQKSLFGGNKLILIDEVDGSAGREDRGGVSELVRIVKESNYPVVFTANDKTSDKIKALKKVAKFIDFENHSDEILIGIAKRIFDIENIKYDEKELISFVEERNSTDIRGFINDLQSSVYESKFTINENLELRDYKKKIELLLEKIFYSYPEDSQKSSYNSDVNIDDLFLYVEENFPKLEEGKALIEGFNEISKADVFRGRIMKWQYWRYLVYINFYLTYGLSSSKVNPKKISISRNDRILKKWIFGNQVNAIRARTKVEKSNGVDLKFIEKLAKVYGRSANRVRKDDIRYFKFIYERDNEFKKSMNNKFDIDESIETAIGKL